MERKAQKKIAILVPCYNEAQTVTAVVKGFKKELPEATVYVFDNNSTDNTAELATKAGAVVVPEYRQGKGNVVRSMFRDIDADCYVMIDGDDTYDASDAKTLIASVLDGRADMVIGDRLSGEYFTQNKRPFHNSGNRLVRKLINVIFGSNVRDIMTGYRAFSKRFVKTFPVLSGGFEIETEMTIHALDKRLSIAEYPVIYRDRPEGSVSKLNTFTDGFRVLRTIGVLFRDYKPMAFFSLIALALFIGGTVLFVPVFLEYIQSGLVLRFPTLILACAIWTMSMLALMCGIILTSIKKYFSELFELKLAGFPGNTAK